MDPERVDSTTRTTEGLVVSGRVAVAGPPPVRNDVGPPGTHSIAEAEVEMRRMLVRVRERSFFNLKRIIRVKYRAYFTFFKRRV